VAESSPADPGEKKLAVQTKASQEAMTPQQALEMLCSGNDRSVAGRPQARNLSAKVRTTAAGQYPFAVILSCLDSRQPIELIFDQGIGDVFNARVADVGPESLVFEVVGEPEELDSFEELVRPHGIRELVRTGRVGLRRASRRNPRLQRVNV
jgi:hypothetical protein